jgi:hypothetical protein
LSPSEFLQNIAQASRRKLHSVISNEEPDQPIDNSDEVVDNLSLDSSQESVSENNYNSSSESQQNVVDILDLREELKCWAINHNITGLAINDLLKTLGKYNSMNFLPKDHRSLLSTRYIFMKRPVGEGFYSHIGLDSSISKQISEGYITLPTTESKTSLDLSLSSDGLPISRSSSSQFWPIQGNCKQSKFGFFVIGIFHGSTKPSSVEEFLDA